MAGMKVPADHPDILNAMRLYDEVLNEEERRSCYLTAMRAAFTAEAEGFRGDWLRLWAESMVGMVLGEVYQPGLREKLRNAPKTVREAGGIVDAATVIREIRETRNAALPRPGEGASREEVIAGLRTPKEAG
jgi:hypothetical protein